MKRSHLLWLGIAATLAVAEVYHGLMGASDRLEQRVERAARVELDRNEMHQVKAELQDNPLTRTLILSGPADDFQRSELVRVMDQVPGVARVEWDPGSLPVEHFPR